MYYLNLVRERDILVNERGTIADRFIGSASLNDEIRGWVRRQGHLVYVEYM
jgi:hypothetical protein